MATVADESLDLDIEETVLGPQESRLTIKSLVLENFKSYAGVQEIGPFHRSFSAIVGPNGSGKSNVIDAILFVFGKQAKTLRLNKVSQLIHNSEQYPDLPSARVTVNFYETVLRVCIVTGTNLTACREMNTCLLKGLTSLWPVQQPRTTPRSTTSTTGQ